MGKSSERQQTTTTQQQPWAGAVPLLQDVARYAPGIFGFGPQAQQGYGLPIVGGTAPSQFGPQFQGQMPTPAGALKGTPEFAAARAASLLGQPYYSTRGIAGQQQFAPQQQFTQAPGRQTVPGTFGLAGLGAGELANIISGRYVTENNPLLEPIARRVAGDISGQFAGVGRYGSGVHQEALARGLADVRYKAQEQERARQLAAISGAPGYDLAPLQAYTAGLEAQYLPISRYADIASQLAGAGVTATQTTPQHRSPLAGAIGGGLSGAALGSSFGGPWGAAIGGGLGALGGLFG